MNASALLTSQGWLGPGHALDSRLTDYGAQTYKQKGHRGLAYDPTSQSQSLTNQISTGNGLVRPLLVSQRGTSKHGIGKKAHEPASGNEWWLKGFASALANVGKSESERSTPLTSGTSTPRGAGAGNGYGYVGKHSGLYSYFTGGEVMKGTIGEQEQIASDADASDIQQSKKRGKKRKSDVLEDQDEKAQSDQIPRSKSQSKSTVRRPQTAAEFETSIPYLTERDKERNKEKKNKTKTQAHNRAQSTDVEAFTVIGSFLGAMAGDKQPHHTKSRLGKEKNNNDDDDDDDIEEDERTETKEERRARRKKRKEEKEKGGRREKKKGGVMSLAQMVEEELAKLSSLDNTATDQDDSSPDSGESINRATRRTRDRDVMSTKYRTRERDRVGMGRKGAVMT